jgi:hypothetical protein
MDEKIPRSLARADDTASTLTGTLDEKMPHHLSRTEDTESTLTGTMDEKMPHYLARTEDTTSTLTGGSTTSFTEKAGVKEEGRFPSEAVTSPTSLAPSTHETEQNDRSKVNEVQSTTAEAQNESNGSVTSEEDGVEYPTGLKLNLISLALCLSVFLIALDNTIIATAIPKITDQFNSLPDVGWYGSA